MAGETPTIVLVHGAWADASSWNGDVDRLQRDGYVVRAIDNPLRGLTSDAEEVKDFLSTITGPIVLVGHSYGGAVITNAAAGNPSASRTRAAVQRVTPRPPVMPRPPSRRGPCPAPHGHSPGPYPPGSPPPRGLVAAAGATCRPREGQASRI